MKQPPRTTYTKTTWIIAHGRPALWPRQRRFARDLVEMLRRRPATPREAAEVERLYSIAVRVKQP